MNNFSFVIILSMMLLTPPDAIKQISKQNIDYVPNKETAIKIAEAIWLPIYGKGIYDNKPFKAELKNGKIWVVEGSLKQGQNVGGAPYIEIQKKDCKILKVSHGK